MLLTNFSRKPGHNLVSFNELMDDFLKTAPLAANKSFMPAVNIVESTDKYRLDMAVPGFSKDEFSIKVENQTLSIAGEKKEELKSGGEKYSRKEFYFTSFKRSFKLPKLVNSEAVEAKYENGILQVSIPKMEEAKAKPAIEIKVS